MAADALAKVINNANISQSWLNYLPPTIDNGMKGSIVGPLHPSQIHERNREHAQNQT